MTAQTLEKAVKRPIIAPIDPLQLRDRNWRLSNLYWIRDVDGNRVKFVPNWAQKQVLSDPHPCKVVLKCRQIGITTGFAISSLDAILWQPDKQAGIIAHNLDDAEHIFASKIKYAYDQLDPRLKPLFRLTGNNAKELAFAHGSTIRVGTSMRSATNQYLHISEYGKICAKYPERALEIRTGALNTVHTGQEIVIESSAEGAVGHFHELCEASRDKPPHNPLEFKFFFFPWYLEPTYALHNAQYIEQIEDRDYFAKLSLDGIQLTPAQKAWYVAKKATQGDEMLREYPTTPQEAFMASKEGFWYATQINELHTNGHVCNVAYDRALPVHTAWDLGQSDATSIFFFQIARTGDINIIDFWERTDTEISQLAIMLKDKRYNYGIHIWPHDAEARDRAGITFVQQARVQGLEGLVLEPHSLLHGINLVRTTLSRCWFDKTKCADGLKHLAAYKKKWNGQFGGYIGEEVHDDASHAAAAMRYLCAALERIASTHDASVDLSILQRYWG